MAGKLAQDLLMEILSGPASKIGLEILLDGPGAATRGGGSVFPFKAIQRAGDVGEFGRIQQ
uniref:Uncharacterized protein n=1 Tax=Aquisalinus luteolus TaxID=1566827 RepID=A0A8J3A5U2_9PROT|nr:hypothetical protein GCM10011355_08840 [Aquisalinus luteolus]